MGAALRILFIGCFRFNCGSSHALLGYARAAARRGYDLRVSSLGLVDESVREKVAVAGQSWTPDVAVMVFESEQFLNAAGLGWIERKIPRAHRLIIDPDAKYSERVSIGADANHVTANSREFWRALYERLSDTILQPSLGPMMNGARRFLYFGVDLYRSPPPRAEREGEKTFDLIYVGNNWYRWHDVQWLACRLSKIRERLARIALFGSYWSGEPMPGFAEHTYSDPRFLLAHEIESYPSVAFDEVERQMGRGKFHPVFVRPVLNLLRMVTPRMFETFAADTVPLLPPYFKHACDLYGVEAAKLSLTEDPADSIMRMMQDYREYASISLAIRERLAHEHSYDRRLEELLSFVA
jgi:hypothetical protein